MRKSILLAIALMVTLVAVPAFASVQNIKVSGSIDSSFVHRSNFDLGLATHLGSEEGRSTQDFFMTQTIVGVNADLTDNVSATVGLINERNWDNSNSVSSSDVDLYLAYVTLREMLYSPLTVVVGRQAFAYGNSFIVDSTGTNNSAPTDSAISSFAGDLTKQTAQDAIRLIFDYKPLTLEFLYSKISANTLIAATDDSSKDDVDLYGANARYDLGDAMNTQIEGYFFAKINQGTEAGASLANKSDTVYVPGLRVSTNPVEGLNLQGEVALQRGTKIVTTTTIRDAEQREAYGAQFIANYKVPVLEQYKPVAQYVYTFVSGDHDLNNVGYANEASREVYTAWDPMFENQAGGKIYNALFNLSNAHIHTASLQVNPMEDVTLKGTATGLWLDKDIQCGGNLLACSTTLVQPDGSQAVTVEDGKDGIGYELDVDATYAYTEDVQIGATLGWFNPGDIFSGPNEKAASQAIVHANVTF